MKDTCTLCKKRFDEGGDGWDDLCPECADKVSEYMDAVEAKTGTEIDRDTAIADVRAGKHLEFQGETELPT